MAQPKKTATEIITDFELQVSDVTEMSTDEELRILNRVYQKVCNKKPWIFLRKEASGTLSQDATGYYLTLPEDFNYIVTNANYTDNAYSNQMNAAPVVIYMGTSRSPLQVINYADRFQYASGGGYGYIDVTTNQLRFYGTPPATTYQFDYIRVPAKLTANDYPVFPGQFHDILVYGMATENDVLQLSPKAKSYAPENLSLFNEYLSDMRYWDSQFHLN